MSLKAFHVVFVTVSAILGLGFGAWAIADHRRSGSAESLWWGVGSLAGTMGLFAAMAYSGSRNIPTDPVSQVGTESGSVQFGMRHVRLLELH